MSTAATPTFAEWTSAITAAETAARNEHSNAIERLEAQRAAADAALEKATAELAAQRKAESRAPPQSASEGRSRARGCDRGASAIWCAGLGVGCRTRCRHQAAGSALQYLSRGTAPACLDHERLCDDCDQDGS
jgi:hypothetical protein